MPATTGVLVANLGTPDAPTPEAVRRFLAEFLSDPRVIDLPRLPWQIILRGVILPFRPKRSAAAYREVWTPAGSPLLTGTEALTRALARRLAEILPEPPAVAMGMTYGNPSIAVAIEALAAPPDRRVIEDYHDDPAHIAAVAARIAAAQAPFDHLLFSFHGIPARYAAAGDPYGTRCEATARLVAARLGLPAERWSLAFQSRVGRARWLEPYTEVRLRELGAAGTRRLAVACPGFAVDCLETLEEIAIRGRETFLESGGGEFEYIPALNDDFAQVDCLARLVAGRLDARPAA
jgi:ferrochelatase